MIINNTSSVETIVYDKPKKLLAESRTMSLSLRRFVALPKIVQAPSCMTWKVILPENMTWKVTVIVNRKYDLKSYSNSQPKNITWKVTIIAN